VAIEVFEGDTGDPATLAAQIDKIKARFALKHVVLGPVDIHLSHIMALTKKSIDTYDSAVFS
jgi:hypothetical protein